MNKMQSVKRRFFAMRNGVLAEILRKGGSSFRIIFGLNLPQIAEIAADYAGDYDLAMELWHNRSTRESMLMAPIILADKTLSHNEIMALVDDVADSEVADIVCHRLLRKRSDVESLIDLFAADTAPIKRYMALRMALGRFDTEPAAAIALAKDEISRDCALTRPVAAMILSLQD